VLAELHQAAAAELEEEAQRHGGSTRPSPMGITRALPSCHR
jgi:hypothetical protein